MLGLRRLGLILALALALPCLAAPYAGPARAAVPEAAAGTYTLAPLLREITPAVVNIATRSQVAEETNPLLNDPFFRRFFNVPEMQQQQRRREVRASGSGVIVDAARGTVLTNNHVVENAAQIEVTTKDRRTFQAKLIGRDPETDIAVLQIDPSNLTALQFADSDRVEVGDFVLAIGNPFGLGQTVTSGIVSAIGRSGLGIEGYEDFIQTDASINPGNSGGALVDLKGRLIGINTAILAPGGGNIGIGFAVPINMARNVLTQLVSYGKVARGRIGISIQDLTPELARGFEVERGDGAVIADVVPGSSADRAGLRRGDLVTSVDGSEIHSASQLRNRVGLARVGDELTLTIERRGHPSTVRTRIEAAPETREQPQQPRRPRRTTPEQPR